MRVEPETPPVRMTGGVLAYPVEMNANLAVLHRREDVTQAWLEAALGRRVREFEAIASESTWGAQVQLVVHLEGDDAPWRLRVKIGDATVFGRAEVDYYTRYFAGLADAPLVRCHHAAADETHYHLLLDDLAATHRNQFEVAPSESYGRALVERIARLHAHQWPQSPPPAAALEAGLQSAFDGLPVLLDAMRAGFTEADREQVRVLFDTLRQRVVARSADPVGYTWIHGDLNPGNVLAPIEGEGEVYLIDHQPFLEARVDSGLGVDDLAYAITLWWPVELRREYERMLIEHWHGALVGRGVRGYSLAQAWDDWRLCSLKQMIVPARWCSEGDAVTRMRWVWEPQLRRVLAAVEDF